MEAPVTRAALTCAVVLACLAAVAAPARGDDRPLSPEAQAHLDRGVAAYQAERYDAAAVELQAAYAIEPRREVLFAWAQAERQRDRCEKAITLYRSFLDLEPPEDEAAKARARLAECEARLEASASIASPLTEPPVPAPAEGERDRRFDRAGLVLLGLGVAAGGAGGAFLYSAQGDNDADDYAAFDRQQRSRQRRYWAGVAGIGLGGVLAAAGLLRLALDDGDRPARVAIELAPGRASVGLAGEF